MPASIVFNQSGAPAGVAGKARSDFVIATLVTCTNSVVVSSYLWTLVDVPIRSALVRGTTGASASFTFTPDVKGTYLVTLRVNASTAPTDNASSFCATITVGAEKLGWRYAAAGERAEDNITRASLGFPANINMRGWATDRDLQDESIETATYRVLNAVTTSPGPGSTPLVKLNTVTGKLDTSIIPAVGTLTTLIYDSGAVASGNTYSNFALAVTAANAIDTFVRLLIAEPSVTIASGGPYDLRNIILVGSSQTNYPTLEFTGTSTLSYPPRAIQDLHVTIETAAPHRMAPAAAESLTTIKGLYAGLALNRTAPIAAFGTVITGPGSAPGLNATFFILNDGVNPAVTFIYAIVPGVDTPTTRYITFSVIQTPVAIATTTRAVINAAPLLAITALGATSTVTLLNDVAGTLGNVTTTHNLPGPFVVTGMAGGVAGGDPWDLSANVWTVHLEDGVFETSATVAYPAVINGGLISVYNHGGTLSPSEQFIAFNGLRNYSHTLSDLTVTAATYNIDPFIRSVGLDSTLNAITLQLCDPQLVVGEILYLYDYGGTWGTNNITLTPYGAESIDNVAGAYTLNVNNSAIILESNGINWYIVASHGLSTGGSGLTALQITGTTGVTTTTRNSEVVLGGLYFDPALYPTSILDLRLVGDFTSTDGASYLELRLYDMGAGTGAFAPVLRSYAEILFAAVGERRLSDQTLTPVPAPGININEIHDVARVYELRAYFSSTDVSSSAHVSWGGLAIS